jgi:membrane fusion protein (multidrug efflux system)
MPSPWINLRLLSAIGGVAAIAIAAAACGSGAAQADTPEASIPPPAVSVVKASVVDLESAIEVSGNLVPQVRVEVHAKLGGTLDRVLVQLGDRVAAGAPLAALDRREIDAQVDAAAAAVAVARASLEAAEAALANAGQEVERARNLFEKGALPRQRMDAADTAHRSARAQRDLSRANVAQAEAAHRRAAEIQRDATLRAPMAGVIVERNYDAGNLVGPGSDQPIVAVADMRALKLEAGVSELDAGRLRVGMPAFVTVTARPGQHFEGRLAALAPEVDRRNRHFQIEVRVPNEGQELLGGMYATARFVVERAPGAVAVPRESVFSRDGARYVYAVREGTIQLARVIEGLSDGSRVQITSGLAAGAVVVADARREVAEGARVRPVAAD